MFYLESVWLKRRMERGIVPENNYLTNYIVCNILKRIDLELKNKVRKILQKLAFLSTNRMGHPYDCNRAEGYPSD